LVRIKLPSLHLTAAKIVLPADVVKKSRKENKVLEQLQEPL
jgi:hypothetical protein